MTQSFALETGRAICKFGEWIRRMLEAISRQGKKSFDFPNSIRPWPQFLSVSLPPTLRSECHLHRVHQRRVDDSNEDVVTRVDQIHDRPELGNRLRSRDAAG